MCRSPTLARSWVIDGDTAFPEVDEQAAHAVPPVPARTAAAVGAGHDSTVLSPAAEGATDPWDAVVRG